MVTAAVTRLQPERALEAAGYIRVSRKVQAGDHSPDIQREAIKRLARQEGYILTDEMIKEDHERGSKVTRKGYQQIIEAVRDGQIQAILVYMFDRWGRDGAEWLTRAREFDRLGVPIIAERRSTGSTRCRDEDPTAPRAQAPLPGTPTRRASGRPGGDADVGKCDAFFQAPPRHAGEQRWHQPEGPARLHLPQPPQAS